METYRMVSLKIGAIAENLVSESIQIPNIPGKPRNSALADRSISLVSVARDNLQVLSTNFQFLDGEIEILAGRTLDEKLVIVFEPLR